MPQRANAIPAHCSAVGESPRTTETASGTIGDVAEIGATMPIAPIARPR